MGAPCSTRFDLAGVSSFDSSFFLYLVLELLTYLVFFRHAMFQIVGILNFFVTFGDCFLLGPSTYDELYYELIRMADTVKCLHKFSKSAINNSLFTVLVQKSWGYKDT